jgi:hypothetical protein
MDAWFIEHWFSPNRPQFEYSHGFLTYFKKYVLEDKFILFSKTLMKWVEFSVSIDVTFDVDKDGVNYMEYLIMDALLPFVKTNMSMMNNKNFKV